jgi:hypothetical protein
MLSCCHDNRISGKHRAMTNSTVISCQNNEVIDMAKVTLQVVIDSDLKKALAKEAIDAEKTMSELIELMLTDRYGKLSDLPKGEKP